MLRELLALPDFNDYILFSLVLYYYIYILSCFTANAVFSAWQNTLTDASKGIISGLFFSI